MTRSERSLRTLLSTAAAPRACHDALSLPHPGTAGSRGRAPEPTPPRPRPAAPQALPLLKVATPWRPGMLASFGINICWWADAAEPGSHR